MVVSSVLLREGKTLFDCNTGAGEYNLRLRTVLFGKAIYLVVEKNGEVIEQIEVERLD